MYCEHAGCLTEKVAFEQIFEGFGSVNHTDHLGKFSYSKRAQSVNARREGYYALGTGRRPIWLEQIEIKAAW